MRVCDKCGIKNDGQDNSVGKCGIRIMSEENIRCASWPQDADLCPKCSGLLKDEMAIVLKKFLPR